MIKGGISTINVFAVHGKSCLDIAQDIIHFFDVVLSHFQGGGGIYSLLWIEESDQSFSTPDLLQSIWRNS